LTDWGFWTVAGGRRKKAMTQKAGEHTVTRQKGKNQGTEKSFGGDVLDSRREKDV